MDAIFEKSMVDPIRACPISCVHVFQDLGEFEPYRSWKFQKLPRERFQGVSGVFFQRSGTFQRGPEACTHLAKTDLFSRKAGAETRIFSTSAPGGHPQPSFEAIFCLKSYFTFLGLFLKSLQQFPLKQAYQ